MKKGNISQVQFDEAAHRYMYFDGTTVRELKGVTAAIARRLGKNFPQSSTTVQLACSYGSQVHKEIERWIEEGKEPDTENGRWLKDAIIDFQNKAGGVDTQKLNAEVTVSDFETTASNVDIVLHTLEGVFLFDIKTGGFDRKYCTMQLNAYRLMYGNSYGEKVLGLYVLNTKSRRTFNILACDDKDILRLLEDNHK